MATDSKLSFTARALRLARIYNRETPAQATAAMHLPAGTVWQIETGQLIPDEETVGRYAEHYAIEASSLAIFQRADTDTGSIANFPVNFALCALEWLDSATGSEDGRDEEPTQ